MRKILRYIIMKLKIDDVVLNEQMLEEELEQLKGGNVLSADEPEEKDIENGTDHCCSW